MNDGAAPYTIEEMMCCVIAREVRDRETSAVGAVSPIPAAGCLLAQRTHAPNATIIILGHPDYTPFAAGSSEFHFLAQRGKLDLFFLSGIQIDGHGNFNLHVIGDYERPQVRMPGAYGSGMLYYMAKRVILFRTEHTKRTFVEKVDFVSGAGSTPDSVYRLGGPANVVTTKALMAFDKQAKGWLVVSAHPGVTWDDLQANTGFPLKQAPGFGVTPPPTAEELRILRTDIRNDLLKIYPRFAQEKLLAPG
ncbi:MAG: CoA synthetase [Chloroflexi bacterium]|nr:CoA synthetase [Chloroflexota bacterium]